MTLYKMPCGLLASWAERGLKSLLTEFSDPIISIPTVSVFTVAAPYSLGACEFALKCKLHPGMFFTDTQQTHFLHFTSINTQHLHEAVFHSRFGVMKENEGKLFNIITQCEPSFKNEIKQHNSKLHGFLCPWIPFRFWIILGVDFRMFSSFYAHSS